MKNKLVGMFFVFVLFATCFVYFTTDAIATPTKETITFSESNQLRNNFCQSAPTNGGEVVFPTVHIGNNKTVLYCTFKDKNKALRYINEKIKNDKKLSKLNIEEITDSNWEAQYEKILTNSEINEVDRHYIDVFFDIYKGYGENEKISKKLISTGDLKSVVHTLPIYSTPKQPFFATNSILPMASPGLDPGKAGNYAVTYATTPNTAAYPYFNQDCTNFMSQVLVAGGIGQDYHNSVYSGWWHRKNWWGGHSNSRSWSVADTFVRYFGTGYQTNTHREFARNIRRGDIIAKDFSNNGSWDHVAYVVARRNYEGYYNQNNNHDKIYHDYLVAQHTSNYLRWTSDPDNGWDNHWGVRYARVRR